MRDVDLAFVRWIAREAHAGQVDLQGRDYFEHHLEPIAESLAHLGGRAVMAGYLHDIVEDCPAYSLERLRELRIPESVVRAVDSVTRRAGESYDELITRACDDPLGVHVKLADNELNLRSNPGLAQSDPDRALALLDRYMAARDRLVAARARREIEFALSQTAFSEAVARMAFVRVQRADAIRKAVAAMPCRTATDELWQLRLAELADDEEGIDE